MSVDLTEHLIAGLHAKRSGQGWLAKCPAHDDANPSLSINVGKDGTVLVYCHAGCQQAAVIASLRAMDLWPGGSRQDRARSRLEPLRSHDRRKVASALQLWCRSRPADGTPVERYLRSRNIIRAVPRRIRYLERAKHPSGSRHPVMIGLITQGLDDQPSGVHRTFLAADGLSKASVSPDKMMLGRCAGGIVKLGAISGPLLIGEGIETTLSAMQTTGLSGWAALSTSGLTALRLPRECRDIIILVDGDDPGRMASKHAAERWCAEGRRVRLATAPDGTDFNDLLRASKALGGPDE
ncbi:MAG: virulence-associated protein E [Hyphomicrobiaceae bacterium]|nr:MAG: virulence-associated protein E [Hyphomicrobiaceae bacterium]